MGETSWKKILSIALLSIVLVALGVSEWLERQSLERMKKEVAALREIVILTNRVAQEGASAATAASQRASDAAMRADIAAETRKQAEQKAQDAMSSAQQATDAAAKANDEVAQLQREREQELNHMQEALSRVAETRRTPQGMVIVLPDSTFRFPFDQATLNQKNRELLSRVAGILLASKGYGLAVYGYTDDVGSADYNQELSLRRAKAVQQYLVKAGLDPALITPKGFGKTSPVVTGTSIEARARNRRVEIAVTDSSIHYGGEVGAPK